MPVWGLVWAIGLASCPPVESGRPPEPRPESASIRSTGPAPGYLAPVALQSGPDGKTLLVVGSTGQRIVILDRSSGDRRRTLSMPAPCGSVQVRGRTAYVTTLEPAGRVLIVDIPTGTIRKGIFIGHTPTASVLSPDGKRLYAANRFDHTVCMVDLETLVVRAIPVVREPVAMALSSDGRRLFVANHLPEVRPFLEDENPFIAAEVSVIDTVGERLLKNIELPNGSQSLRGITLSPDGRQVVVTHILSNYTVPTWRIDTGLMNRNVLSLLDAKTLEWIATVPLDDPHRGAANPWAVTFAADARHLLVTHTGVNELSVIDYPTLLARVATHKGPFAGFRPEDLAFMDGIRQRIQLPVRGPRSVLACGDRVYVLGFFSDSLAVVDLTPGPSVIRDIPLATSGKPSMSRLGEQYFHDASLCLEQWQSCATCHPDGRSDALYWDLLNDGLGNTKNTKSLLMSVLTPPVMWRGVRADAATAIAAGIHHVQFAHPDDKQVDAIEAYLRHMPIVPSPHLDMSSWAIRSVAQQSDCAKCHPTGVAAGRLTPAARRGKAIFDGKGQCSTCHPHPTFTNGQAVDPGLGNGVRYDVPSLIEVWRTAPYLHSGEALTLREAITDFNLMERRGRTRDLTESELEDLLAYLRSL